eukprot:8712256-Pyramimonas_sp.AAC.2
MAVGFAGGSTAGALASSAGRSFALVRPFSRSLPRFWTRTRAGISTCEEFESEVNSLDHSGSSKGLKMLDPSP